MPGGRPGQPVIDLIRPDGLVEKLAPRPRPGFEGYDRLRPGAIGPAHVQAAAGRDRRGRRRRRLDPFRGRLIDLVT